MASITYLDFELKIAGQDGRYVVQVLRSPAGEARCEFHQTLGDAELENLLLKLARVRSVTRRVDSPELAAARELGAELFRATFRDTVRDCLRNSLASAQRDGHGLRLKLRLQDAPQLAVLPWEFLYDPDAGRFLARSAYTPVVRYVELPEIIPAFPTVRPLRLLGIVASPHDYDGIDVPRERRLVEEALQPLVQSGQLEISWLEKPTVSGLRRALRNSNYHILHFVGHGGFHNRTQQGVLVFEDERAHSALVNAETIGVLLHDHHSLRLAILNACEGARSAADDPFASVATTLVRQGIPAVIAMQFLITDQAALAFAEELYAAVADGLPVDTAVAEARKAVLSAPNEVEWGTPVLFLRTADGVLFDFRAKAPAQQGVVVDSPIPEDNGAAAAPENPPQNLEGSKLEETRLDTPNATAVPASNQDNDKSLTDPESTSVSGAVLFCLGDDLAPVHSVAFSPDGRLIASGSRDKTVRLWDAATGTALRTLKGHNELVNSVAFSPDGKAIASGSYDKTVRLWDAATGASLRILKGQGGWINAVAFSPDGKVIASGWHEQVLDGGYLPEVFVTGVWLAKRSLRRHGKTIWQWDTETETEIRALKGHGQSVYSVAFSPNGKVMASGSDDNAVMLWDTVTGSALHTLTGHDWTVTSVSFSPDGKTVASGSYDKTVRLWDTATGTALRTLTGHNHWVTSVSFSPDGKTIASGSDDRTVRLWDRATGTALQIFNGHSAGVNSIAFRPDGKVIASGSDDNAILLWSVTIQ